MTFNYLPANSISPSLNESFVLTESNVHWRDIIVHREIDTAKIVNGKTNGTFSPVPGVSGEQWQNPVGSSPVLIKTYRVMIQFGVLPNTATTSVAHNINVTAKLFITHLYGSAINQAGRIYLPLPYASPTLANNIELNMDATNINITTGSNRTAYTGYVIVEYGYSP